MGIKKGKIVEILWTDAVVGSTEEWIEPSQLKHKAMPSKSVGYLMYKDNHVVVIASLMNESHVGLTMIIPRRMIDDMRELTCK